MIDIDLSDTSELLPSPYGPGGVGAYGPAVDNERELNRLASKGILPRKEEQNDDKRK